MSSTPDNSEDIAKTLHLVAYFLSAAYSACVTVELALERQAADHDLEFARTLHLAVRQPLSSQVKTLQNVCERLGSPIQEVSL